MSKLGKICWTRTYGWKIPASFLNKTHFWIQTLALLHPDGFTLANEKLTLEESRTSFSLLGSFCLFLHLALLRLLAANGYLWQLHLLDMNNVWVLGYHESYCLHTEKEY